MLIVFSFMLANLIHSSLSESIQTGLCNHSSLSFDWWLLYVTGMCCCGWNVLSEQQTSLDWRCIRFLDFELQVILSNEKSLWNGHKCTFSEDKMNQSFLRNGKNTARCWRVHHSLVGNGVSVLALLFVVHFVIQKPKQGRPIGGDLSWGPGVR